MAAGPTRLADQLASIAAEPAVHMEPGVITAVSAGAAADGAALVTVSWRGASVFAPYPSTYTPVVGHTVLLLIQATSVVIAARLIGTPN